MSIDPEWLSADKPIDQDFAGSIWEELGYSSLLCPTCGAHLHDGICLNACHLTKKSRDRFNQIMEQVVEG